MLSRCLAVRTAFLALTVAGALSCPSGAWAQDTVLRMAETATVLAAPDELAASLRADVTAPTAREAQQRVNGLMRDAVASARKVEGISVSNGGYTVWRTGTTAQERWQAGETLTLSGRDGEALLKLVAELQQKGLVTGELRWRLSRDMERKSRKDATKQALTVLRGRIDETADLLGLRFEAFREVRLDNTAAPVTPRGGPMTRGITVSQAASPPTAETDTLPVTATVEADVLLRPRDAAVPAPPPALAPAR